MTVHKLYVKIFCVSGSAKFGAVLPWERDADLDFVLPDQATMDTVIKKMENYGLIPMISRRSHLHITPRSGWKIEFWGYVDEQLYRKRRNSNHTRVIFDGMWLKTDHYNPGAELLRRFVDNIYRHLEHSEMLRGSRTRGGNDYKNPGFFNKCRDPVFKHACLDQLSPDGNIQFKDPIP